MIEIITALICAIPAFFLWVVIHEMSHYIAYKLTTGVISAKFKLYPHIKEGEGPWWKRFRWAAIRVEIPRDETISERFLISFAPRLLAMIAFPITALVIGIPGVVIATLVGAGLVDLLVGSLGISPNSDLQKAAAAAIVSPWILRIAGFTLTIISLTYWITLKLLV